MALPLRWEEKILKNPNAIIYYIININCKSCSTLTTDIKNPFITEIKKIYIQEIYEGK